MNSYKMGTCVPGFPSGPSVPALPLKPYNNPHKEYTNTVSQYLQVTIRPDELAFSSLGLFSPACQVDQTGQGVLSDPGNTDRQIQYIISLQ